MRKFFKGVGLFKDIYLWVTGEIIVFEYEFFWNAHDPYL